MNKYLKLCSLALLANVITFLLFAFFAWDINAGCWTGWLRFLCTYILAVPWVMAVITWMENER